MPSEHAFVFRCTTEFKEIDVSLIFVSWLSHILSCTVKHDYLRRDSHFILPHFAPPFYTLHHCRLFPQSGILLATRGVYVPTDIAQCRATSSAATCAGH